MIEEKNNKSRIVLGFSILLLLSLIPVVSIFNVSSSNLSANQLFLNRTSSINVTVIIDSTFDQNIDFKDLLAAYETKYSSKSSLQYSGYYYLDLEYRYLTNQEHNDFITYLQSTQNVGGPNGYEINTSVTLPEEADEFIIEKEGVAFNTTDTILWLADNLWNQKKNEYSLFLFNLTDVDAESGLPHWWLNKPVDIDTNSVPLGLIAPTIIWSDQLTYGSQVPAWGGWRYPIHFIDLSTEHWMGEFIRAINESPFSWNWPTSSYNHLLTDLSDFGNPVNVSDVLFLSWLESWVNDFILGIYRDSVLGSGYFKISENISAQTLVLNNWSEHQDNDEISWLIHDDRIDAEFSRAFTWIDFEVTTTWKDLSDFPSLEEEITKYITFDTFDGTPEIELSTGFATYCQDTFFPSVFDYTAAGLVLPSLIFLFDNTSFTYEGNRIRASSFGEFQIMGLESTIFFRKDGVTPDSGLSWWILHEVGHSLGLRHPFAGSTAREQEQLGWGSMFTNTPMTYYHHVSEFSIYDTNAIGHATSDYYLAPAEWYASELEKLSEVNSSASFVDALTLLRQAQDVQKDWNYSGAILLAKEALTSLKDLFSENRPTSTSKEESFSPFVFVPFSFICLVVVLRKYKKT